MKNLKFINNLLKINYSKLLALFFLAITPGISNAIKCDLAIHGNLKNTKKNEQKSILEKTLAIIKPDAVQAKNSGEIIKIIELNKFNIINIKKIQLTKKQAEEFYGLMRDKPFFKDLVNYMTSGPLIIMILEKENGIQDWRNLMGVTNPEKANIGTIRKMFGSSIEKNAVHGSDSKENAAKEMDFFFKKIC